MLGSRRADEPTPAFAIGFSVPRKRALAIAQRWRRRYAAIATREFLNADIASIEGIYVPSYLYSAAAHLSYTAKIGENYTVTTTTTSTDSNGNTTTRTSTRIETEWRRLEGNWASYIDEVLVTASTGLDNDELEAIEPFDLRQLRRYHPGLVSGWLAENPSMTFAESRDLARPEAVRDAAKQLRAFLPGDHCQRLAYETVLRNEDLELVLLPIWVLAIPYDDGRPPLRLLINGQTGAITGRPPRSVLKIALWILLVCLPIIGLLVMAVVN